MRFSNLIFWYDVNLVFVSEFEILVLNLWILDLIRASVFFFF